MGILEKVVVMKLCLFLSMVVLVQSKPGPKPKPEPKPGRWLRTQDLMPRAEAMPTTFNSDSSCVCMTPSHNQINEDPDDMCINKNMCYVDCNSMCRDVQNAVGAGRCFSRRACEGRVLEKCGDYNRPCEDCRYHECQESEKCKWSSWGGNRNDKWRPQGPYGFCKPRDPPCPVGYFGDPCRCFDDNTRYYKKNVIKGEYNHQPSRAACRNSCRYHPKCYFWTWVKNSTTWGPAKGQCFLKNAR